MTDHRYPRAEIAARRTLVVQRPGSVLRGIVEYRRRSPAADLVLILAGAGRLDIDGNTGSRADSPGRMLHRPYARLAARLAARGYTVARFQRSTTPFSADASALPLEERVEDCLVMAAALRRQTEDERLFLLGHGEGGLVALAATRELEPDGLILLETPAKPMEELVADQLLAGAGQRRRPAVAGSLARLRERLLSAGDGEPVLWLGRPLPPASVRALRSRYGLRPMELARSVSTPTLVVQGTADRVVGPDNGPLLAAALEKGDLRLIPGMTYGLTLGAGFSGTPAGAPLHPLLLWTLLSWLESAPLVRRADAVSGEDGEVPA